MSATSQDLGRFKGHLGWLRPDRKVKRFAGVLIYDQSRARILLGMKKRGFGTDLWQHSFCGKVETSDRDLAHTALRELQEESGLSVPNPERDLRFLGMFCYEFTEDKDLPFNMEVAIFTCDIKDTSGTILHDNDEIRPVWHDYDEIPYSSMWPDNHLWLPTFLQSPASKRLNTAYVLYNSLTSVQKYELEWV